MPQLLQLTGSLDPGQQLAAGGGCVRQCRHVIVLTRVLTGACNWCCWRVTALVSSLSVIALLVLVSSLLGDCKSIDSCLFGAAAAVRWTLRSPVRARAVTPRRCPRSSLRLR
jgi:hypothetical protein